MKKVDCALLPPCANTVKMKVQRAHYISIVWGNADTPQPANAMDPLEYGWAQQGNDCLTPVWFQGPPLPDDISRPTEEQDEGQHDEAECNEIGYEDVSWSDSDREDE